MKIITDADKYLGPSDARFFSSGYKKVNYELTGEKIQNKNFSSNLKIIYQKDWSIKKKCKLSPHLSSIDVMLMSANACGKVLTSLNKVDFEISQITIRASRKPVEDLNSIKIIFDIISENDHEIIFSGKVGNMNIVLKVIRQKEQDQQLSSRFNIEGFKHSKQLIENIRLKSKFESEANVVKSVKGDYSERVDYIDAFVSGLQLGQILLYELDDVARESSNNLWMRSVNFKFQEKKEPSNKNNLDVALENISLMKKDDTEWRSADIVANLNHIQIRCSVTHQLNR